MPKPSLALESVLTERNRQDEKWGVQNHKPSTWLLILMEEVGEFSEAALNLRCRNKEHISNLREEAVQVAAVALAIVESIDRNTNEAK